MKHGTYVRGWKFDWEQAKRDVDRLLAAGRDVAAAHYADPGVTQCPVCGEMHWNEFEVFLCSRCGAEVDTKTKTSGPPAKPEMVRPRLYDGMRVRFVSYEFCDFDGKPKKRDGRWSAGTVKAGSVGTVRCLAEETSDFLKWIVDFDNMTPKPGFLFGIDGPFLQDDFEEIPV